MAVPCPLLFLLLQRRDVRGFMSGALRGRVPGQGGATEAPPPRLVTASGW